MKFRVDHRPALLPLVVPCRRVLAFPLSYTSTVTVETYIPLVVISMSLFFFIVVFLAVKLVYMKHRRIGTIHAPPGTVYRRTSGFGLRDEKGYWHRALLVGCLGSPTWETNLTSKLDGATWRRGYHVHTSSTSRSTRTVSVRSKPNNCSSSSRFTKSTALTGCSSGAGQLVLPLLTGPSRIPSPRGGNSSKALCSVRRTSSTDCHHRYGDFGESHRVRSLRGVPDVARRVSPSSIRLVDGPSHSNQVEYSFLSSLPPDAIVVSPLMSTRDSFQLCRCSLRCNRSPVPPMPPLPSFLPFYLPKGPEILESPPLQTRGYLPLLRFSPLASIAKVFHSQQVVETKVSGIRIPDPNVRKGDASKIQHTSNAGLLTRSSIVGETVTQYPARMTNNHKKSQSCQGLAIGGLSPRTTLVTDEVAALSSSTLGDKRCSGLLTLGPSRNGSVVSKKVVKSCLRQNPVVRAPLVGSPGFTPTPSMSESSTQICTLSTRQSTGGSLQTPISEVDIRILGLDRFH